MKILLTGCTGQLGQEIIKESPKEHKLLTPTRDELDLSDKFSCKKYVDKNKPDLIINSGAFTNVDQAEMQKDLCHLINVDAPVVFANLLKEYGGKLLQISTDYVFDGNKNSPYEPNDLTNPISVYGYTKAKAESLTEKILKTNGQLVILRTSWLMGHKGNNFINTMLKLHKKGNSFSVVYDQIGAMTSTSDLAKVCWQIINNWHLLEKNHHICHWTCSGIASWYDIAVEIGLIAAKLKILDKPVNITPIRSKEYKTLATRPKFSILDCNSTRKIINQPVKYWRTELHDIFLKIVDNKSLL